MNPNERIRVLFVIQGLRATGPGKHLVKLITYRNPDTVDVELFTFDRNDPEMRNLLVQEYGIHITEIGFRITNPLTYLRGVPHLIQRVRSFRPHVIQTHHTPIIDWVARVVSNLCRVPVNVSRAVVMPKYYQLTRRQGLLGWLGWMFSRTGDWLTSFLVDYYLPNSQTIAIYMHDVEKIPNHKLITVLNGVDTDYFVSSADLIEKGRLLLNLQATDRLVSNIGLFKEAKGQLDLVLSALQLLIEFPEMKIAFVGKPQSQDDEQYLQALKNRIHNAGLDHRFVFTGELTDVRPVLAASDLYVHPSHLEGSSNALLEAMAMGCACVVSDADGCREPVADGGGGVVVPCKDIAALTQAIRILWLNQEQRLQMGSLARKRAVAHYSVHRMCAEVEDVYRKGLEAKGIHASLS